MAPSGAARTSAGARIKLLVRSLRAGRWLRGDAVARRQHLTSHNVKTNRSKRKHPDCKLARHVSGTGRQALQQVIKTQQNIIGTNLLSIRDVGEKEQRDATQPATTCSPCCRLEPPDVKTASFLHL
ncbi:hypothetical protein EYF80_046351 [Liparis tanakae]|uniref:Uncharacterized protein n=1 Tax=Liparis tanakae TaxID=230148 RepID=A0A4Z2FRQ4_9TELE|nr:hypothetical protein EYF80_046351 [Liparis tanakae]